LMFSEVGMRPPQYTQSTEEFSWLDSKFNDRIEFYNSYIVGEKIFDRTNTDRALRAAQGAPGLEPLTQARLREHFQWYLPQLIQERANLPVSR